MFYHVTPVANVPSIMANGLVPSIGERSAALGEVDARVYLFTSLEACEEGLANWLGDTFTQLADDELVVLELKSEGISGVSEAGYEIACLHAIPPTHIARLLDENLASI